MTQRDLNRAVASATGESLRDIADHGFSLMTPPNDDCGAAVDGDKLDCDSVCAMSARYQTAAAF